MADANIFSIFQLNNGPLLLASNKGLYQLKGGRFVLAKADNNQQGKAVFDLSSDKNGDVYCINLNGQIFKYNKERESLNLYYTVPSEYLTRNLSIEFDDDNNLWVGCKRIIMYDGTNSIVSDSPLDAVERMDLASTTSREISITTKRKDTVLIAHSGQLHPRPIPMSEQLSLDNMAGNAMIYLDTSPFLFLSTGRLYSFKDSLIQYSTQIAGKVSRVDDQEIWIRGGTVGAKYIRVEGDRIFQSEMLFPSEFISCVHKKNGTVILGTFGSGIIIIPNLSSLSETIGAYKPIYLTGDEDSQFVITRSGQIHHFERGRFVSVIDSLAQVTRIFHVPNSLLGKQVPQHNLVHPFLKIEEELAGISGLKSVNRLDSETVLAAGTDGVFRFGKGLDGFKWNSWGLWGWEKLEGFNYRSHDIVYDQTEDKLVIASSHRLVICDQNGQWDELKFKSNSIVPSDLASCQDLLIAATVDNGIIIFKNLKPIKHLTQSDGLIDNSIKKVIVSENDLYVLTGGGLQIISLSDFTVRKLGKTDGLINTIIEDFIVTDSLVYYLADNKLNSFRKSGIFQLSPKNNILFSAIYNMENEVSFKAQKFSHDRNHFKFFIDYQDIQFLSGLSVSYRLRGLEETWSTLQTLSSPIEYKSLAPGKYKLEVQPYFNGQSGKIITYEFEIEKPYWTTWWFYFILMLMSLVIFYVIYRVYLSWRLRREKLKNELSASKLTAIQSQMNPHFIFNALNSIQDLVLKDDKKNSYTYITKFASLVRKTLNYSDKDLIELNQEVKLIELYLTIEKLRFKSDFEYELDYPDSEVLVPPMIVQPFIENALVHGLLHKEGLRQLSVQFKLEDDLVCEITDNGVGRQEAESIKLRQRGQDYESFSVKANQRRFNILSELYRGDFGYTYVDMEENGRPAGTKVVLKLPYIKKF